MGKNKKIPRTIRNFLIFLFIFSFSIIGKEKSFYSVQIITLPEKSLNKAINIAKNLENSGFKDVRVEKIRNYIVVRSGLFDNYNQAKEDYIKIKKIYRKSFLRKCYYKKERIIYPALKKHPLEKKVETKSVERKIIPVEKIKPEVKKPNRKGILTLIFIIFWILIFLPFTFAIIEAKKPKENTPLSINMEYVKNPRYFDTSFRKILLSALKDTRMVPSFYNVKLSKEEKVEISENKNIKSNSEINHIIFVKGNLKTGENVVLHKEIYSKGKINIGKKNILRAITSEDDIQFSEGVKVVRWAGSDKNIYVEKGCNLGVITAAEKMLKISSNCTFRRLYGQPVVTGEEIKIEKDKKNEKEIKEHREIKEISDISLVVSKKWAIIASNSKIEKDIISKSSLLIKEHSEIYGSIKVYGKLILEKGVKIDGNIFGESEIEIGENCVITGDVFSQENIKVGNNVVIGKKGKIKSLIARNKIVLGKDVSIYGFILAENEGTVL